MNMVSDEGAAHLVAKELGVNVLNSERKKLELRNIIPGMRNVVAIGRVFRISNIVDFKKSNGTEGRVVNLFIGDRTGFVRVTLWNEQVSLVEDEQIKLDDIVQISRAFARENIYGDVELTVGKFGSIFPVTEEAIGEGMDFPTTETLAKAFDRPKKQRVPIKNLSAGNFEVKGIVVDVIKGRFIFNTCPKCGKKLNEDNGKFVCDQHGECEPKPEMVLSFVVDDSTGALRIVAFREVAEKIATTTASEISKLEPEERHKLISGTLLGKDYIIHGNVKKNRVSGNLEMITDTVTQVNVTEEGKRLVELLKMKLG
jgi:replication factor A1